MKNCCQTNTTRQHKCFRCQSRLNVVTRMLSSSFLLSHSEGILNSFPIFIREPPQFKWSAVRHSNPFVVLVTMFFKEKVMRHITACYQLNANQKYYPIMKLFNEIINQNVSKYAIEILFNMLSRNIKYVDKKYYM